MKQIYLTLMMLVAGLSTSLQLNAAIPGYDITLSVDDPARVKVEFCEYSTPKQTVEFGNARQVTVEWPAGMKLRVSATDGNVLTSVTLGGEDKFISSMLQCSIDFDRNNSDETVDIVSRPLDRSVSFTVNVDCPDKLKMFNDNTMRDRDNQVYFTETTNVFAVDPEIELPVKFNGNRWNDNILKATLNGVDITNASDSYYELSPGNGDVLNFYFEAPSEQTFNVKFDYGEKAHGIVSSVKVNDVIKSDFDGSDFEVPAGASLKVGIDTENFDITSVKRNGESVRWSNGELYLDAVREDITFSFDAHRLGKITVSITVDQAEGVQVFNSSYNNHKPLTLVDGANAVEVDETVSRYLCIVSHPDFRLLSVDINGAPMDREYINYYKFSEGDNIVITTERLVRDKTAIIYIDSPDHVYAYRNNESMLSLSAGYNIVAFSQHDNPLLIYHPAYAAINGRRIYSESEDDYIHNAVLADGDVLKMYVNEAPALHNLAFTVSGDASRFEIVKDLVTPFAAADCQVEHASRIVVRPVGDNIIDVKANGMAVGRTLEHQIDGYHIDVVADTSVDVAVAGNAIDAISVDAPALPTDIYGLDGSLVKRAATRADLENLAPGFYIAGGRKFARFPR